MWKNWTNVSKPVSFRQFRDPQRQLSKRVSKKRPSPQKIADLLDIPLPPIVRPWECMVPLPLTLSDGTGHSFRRTTEHGILSKSTLLSDFFFDRLHTTCPSVYIPVLYIIKVIYVDKQNGRHRQTFLRMDPALSDSFYLFSSVLYLCRTRIFVLFGKIAIHDTI